MKVAGLRLTNHSRRESMEVRSMHFIDRDQALEQGSTSRQPKKALSTGSGWRMKPHGLCRQVNLIPSAKLRRDLSGEIVSAVAEMR